MPIYEYQCNRCEAVVTRHRKIADRDKRVRCKCGANCKMIFSRTSANCWQGDWKFPNTSPHGDGTTSHANESAYKAHLEKHGMREVGLGIREL